MSASSIDRHWHCAGSRAAEKDLPELRVEEVAETGTKIHASLESGDDEDLELSEREIKEKLSNMERAALDQWMEEFPSESKVETYRERRLWIRDRSTLDLLASAQLDVYHIRDTYAEAVDFKTGFAEQTPSERNWQLRVQALALWHEYPHLTHIRMAIAHSRLSSKFDACDFTVADLQNVERDLQFLIWKSEQPDAPRVPGSHCRWCRARGVCAESATYALVVAQAKEFGTLKNSLDVAAMIQRMTPSQLKFIHERKSLAVEIMDGAIQRLKGLPPEQLALLGLKLADGAKLKPVTNVKLAYERLEAVLGRERMMDVISVARGKAADVLCEQQQTTLKAAKEKVDEILGDALTEKEGAKRLKSI